MNSKKTFDQNIRTSQPLSADTQPTDWIGSMRDTMKIMGDLVSPANEESDWEVLAETRPHAFNKIAGDGR